MPLPPQSPRLICWVASWVAAALCIGVAGGSDFPPPHNSEADRAAMPMPADEAAKRFGAADGFETTVFAAEPDVQNPIAMTWDSRGRMWVAENYTYAERPQRFDLSLRDRVLVLEDTTGDGVADRRTVFTDRVQMLTSVEVGHGGVWLMCPPRLLFIPDADGDAVPDGPAEVVLDGFDVAKENYHNFANGLRLGPDGWLYGRCGGSCPGRIGKPGTPDDQRFAIEGGIWRYHPVRKTVEVLCAGTTNPWGHDWNEFGELFFVNTVNGHLWHLIPGAHYVRPFTLDPNPTTYRSIDMHADHWHFDTGKGWKDSRDGGADSLGGGHAHSGTLIYQGDQWPEAYRGRLMTLNFHGRRINQEILNRSGSGYVASHGEDMLLSQDPFFRGIDLSCGPDGSVYVLDWSDTGECHENTGVHRTSGRIFRVTHRADDAPARPGNGAVADDLRDWDSERLVELHRGRNQWHVRQARRILQEGSADGGPVEAAAESLRTMAQESDSGVACSALLTLIAMQQADVDFLRGLLSSPHESSRVWAIRGLSDRWPIDDCFGPVDTVTEIDANVKRDLISVATGDPSGLVRLTLASTLQRMPLGDRAELAAALCGRGEDANDHNLPLMVWYGLMPVVETDAMAVAAVAEKSEWPLIRQLISRRLAERMDRAPEPLEWLVKRVGEGDDVTAARDLVAGIADGLKGWRKATRPVGWERLSALALRPSAAIGDEPQGFPFEQEIGEWVGDLSAIFGDGIGADEVRRIVLDETQEIGVRRSALMALINQRPGDLAEVCAKLVRDPRINLIAAQGLTLDGSEKSAQRIVDSYIRFRPTNRPSVIAMLVSRKTFADVLLSAIEENQIPHEDLTAYDARAIRSLGDERLSARLAEVWGVVRETPEERVAMMVRLKRMLLQQTPDVPDLAAGRLIYQNLCGKCHKLYGEGQSIGPDLTGSNRNNLDYLIENTIDPSAVVDKAYRVSLVMMTDGRVLNGVVVSQSERAIRLQTQSELVVIDRDDVEEIRLTPQSPMPDGQLDNLTDDQIRDLFAYLMHPAQVELPPSD